MITSEDLLSVWVKRCEENPLRPASLDTNRLALAIESVGSLIGYALLRVAEAIVYHKRGDIGGPWNPDATPDATKRNPDATE